VKLHVRNLAFKISRGYCAVSQLITRMYTVQ
jgi:hypothetical protein